MDLQTRPRAVPVAFLHGRSRMRHMVLAMGEEKTPINQFNLINTHLVGDRVLVWQLQD
jgi:hypothetical protein